MQELQQRPFSAGDKKVGRFTKAGFEFRAQSRLHWSLKYLPQPEGRGPKGSLSAAVPEDWKEQNQ